MGKDTRIDVLMQESREGSRQLDGKCVAFLLPLLRQLAEHLDMRLVQTFIRLVKVILIHRHRNEGLWLSELGGYLLAPLQAEAGRKRLTRFLHSARWRTKLIDDFLWQQADQRVKELQALSSDVWLIWDESVIEKAESEKAEGLMPVRSSKASRLVRRTPFAGKPIFVSGIAWFQLLVTGARGHMTLAHMRWWTSRGKYATTQRAVAAELLREVHKRWGQQVVHLWDRGFAGRPWLHDALECGVRFIVRWPARYLLEDERGCSHKPSEFTRRHRSWGHGELWDLRHRCKRKIGVAAVQVWLDGQPFRLVVARRPNKAPWYFLTREPASTFEQAWRIVAGYTRRWQVEMSFRCNKTEFAFESPRQHDWEHRLKLLSMVTLAYAFLLSFLNPDQQELRTWLLDRWCHRTGRRNRETAAPLYRLRQAISRLWLAFPPNGLPLLNTG